MACLLFLLLSLVGCSSPALAAPYAPTPTVSGVRLWQDAAIFSLVGRLIGGAQRRVMVEMYELGRNDLVRGLGSARARGAEVRVITDPTVKASRTAAVQLASAGVPERAYPIDDSRHQIDHVKLLIVDGEAVVGGMNWGKHSDRNHDYALEAHARVDVERLVRIFEQDWTLAGGHPSPLPPTSSSIAQTSPGAEIRTMLEAALRRAVRRVLAEVYTLTDAEVIALLVEAHGRGADVRVVLDPNQVYNLHAFALLRAGGVDVRWYPVPKGVLLHAKIGLFDATLVLGSANWTLAGLGVNHELDIATTDPQAVASYAVRFDADWARSRS